MYAKKIISILVSSLENQIEVCDFVILLESFKWSRVQTSSSTTDKEKKLVRRIDEDNGKRRLGWKKCYGTSSS